MLPLLRSELFKLTHRMMTRVLLLVMMAAPLATYILLGSAGESQQGDVLKDLRIGALPQNAMLIVYQLGVITAIVLTASSVATEFSTGTIRTLLPRTAGRPWFLTAKLASLALFVVLAVVIGYLSALGGSLLVTQIKDLDSSLGGNFIGRLLGSMLKTGYVILPYAAMAFLIAGWSRSTAAGIAIPIVLFYAEVLLTPAFTSVDAIQNLPDALIYSANISSLLDSDTIISKEDLPSHAQAAAVLAVYVSAFISMAYGRFLTQDIR
jgi:ABC-2 type transport system permease protein